MDKDQRSRREPPEAPTAPATAPAYRGEEPYVFVCYAHSDSNIVYPELAWLREQGINVWYDEGISPGSEFPEELGQAILGSTLVLYYVSNRSVASRHCRDEVYFALDRDKRVLAVHLETVELPAGLALTTATTQAIERYRLPTDIYQPKLLEGIRSTAATAPPGDRSRRQRRQRRTWRIATTIAAILIASVCSYALFNYLQHERQVRWAEREALPQLQQMLQDEWRDFVEAYDLALQVEAILPGDPRLTSIFDQISLKIAVESDPAGATVSVKPYAQPDAPWISLGETPLQDIRLPITVMRWRFEKPGYTTIDAAHSTWNLNPTQSHLLVPNNLFRKLDPADQTPAGMVRVAGAETPSGTIADFYIDRFEVTNADYQQFVDDGGYQRPEFWQYEFVDNGVVLDFTAAMAKLVDQSGRPGPSTWLGGTFEGGKENYPVSGVSWYEAAAYAAYKGHYLPSGTHWGLARGEQSTLIQFPQLGGHALFTPFSNFGTPGTVPVGSLPGITSYGAYDLAGNVREWCFNTTASGRLVRGGSYQDNPYKFEELAQAPPFFRTPGYGFRTVLLPDGMKPQAVFDDIPITPQQNYRAQDVVSDEIFEVFLRQFDYDHKELDVRFKSRYTGDFWTSERVSIDLPYDEQRMDLVLFLPKNAQPPYQTVIYFPGSGSIFRGSSEHLETYYEFPVFLSFLVRTGRAVVYPIYNGTFERADETTTRLHVSLPTNAYTSYMVKLVKDFRRSLDYLESRSDIDADRIAYYGMSWGGVVGAVMTAADDRVATAIYLSGGLTSAARPEVHPLNYAPRVTVPVLMLSGQYDSILGYEFAIQPLYDLLGTPAEHKRLIVYPTDHIPPKKEFVSEILRWLDHYFGSVQHKH